jgi:hypothetical protein
MNVSRKKVIRYSGGSWVVPLTEEFKLLGLSPGNFVNVTIDFKKKKIIIGE